MPVINRECVFEEITGFGQVDRIEKLGEFLNAVITPVIVEELSESAVRHIHRQFRRDEQRFVNGHQGCYGRLFGVSNNGLSESGNQVGLMKAVEIDSTQAWPFCVAVHSPLP